MKIKYALMLLFVCVPLLCEAQGTIIAEHYGASDPTSEGFSLLQAGNTSLAPVSNDLGMNAWSIGVGSGTDIGQYTQPLTPDEANALSAGWILSLNLRVSQPVSPGTSGIFATVNVGSKYFFLGFGMQNNGNPAVELADYSQYFLNQGGSGYHNYQLIFDSKTDLASLWVDGSEWLNGIQGSSDLSSASLVWGISQHASDASYYANWNEVSLQSVPEPATISLFFFGAIPILSLFLMKGKAVQSDR